MEIHYKQVTCLSARKHMIGAVIAQAGNSRGSQKRLSDEMLLRS